MHGMHCIQQHNTREEGLRQQKVVANAAWTVHPLNTLGAVLNPSSCPSWTLMTRSAPTPKQTSNAEADNPRQAFGWKTSIQAGTAGARAALQHHPNASVNPSWSSAQVAAAVFALRGTRLSKAGTVQADIQLMKDRDAELYYSQRALKHVQKHIRRLTLQHPDVQWGFFVTGASAVRARAWRLGFRVARASCCC
jgi:hypothetical protein